MGGAPARDSDGRPLHSPQPSPLIFFPPPAVTQPVVHIAFIPAILALGMAYTEPRPSLVQLLAPM